VACGNRQVWRVDQFNRHMDVHERGEEKGEGKPAAYVACFKAPTVLR
jgi:hypothetical protein